MKHKTSLGRILYLLYLIVLLILTGVPHINPYLPLGIIFISGALYFTQNLKYTHIGFIVISIIFLIHTLLLSMSLNMQELSSYERSAIGLKYIPYYIGVLLILTLLLGKDIFYIKNNEKNHTK